jgi:hypothetical protein
VLASSPRSIDAGQAGHGGLRPVGWGMTWSRDSSGAERCQRRPPDARPLGRPACDHSTIPLASLAHTLLRSLNTPRSRPEQSGAGCLSGRAPSKRCAVGRENVPGAADIACCAGAFEYVHETHDVNVANTIQTPASHDGACGQSSQLSMLSMLSKKRPRARAPVIVFRENQSRAGWLVGGQSAGY